MKCICGQKMTAVDRSTFSRSDLGGKYNCECGWHMRWNSKAHHATWTYEKGIIIATMRNNDEPRFCQEGYKIWAADNSIKLARVNTATEVFASPIGQQVLAFIQRMNNLKAFW